MHLPNGVLNPGLCPVTYAVALTGVSGAILLSQKMNKCFDPVRFSGVTAVIFAMQMLNFPVTTFASGHLVGGVLAASLLGVPLAILAMTLVLVLQCVLLGDGGITALGANVINMALIGAGLGGMILKMLQDRGFSKITAIIAASFSSTVLAALACAAQLSFANAVSFSQMAGKFIPVHMVIGVAEAVLTLVLIKVFTRLWQTEGLFKVMAPAGLSVTGIALSPWASVLPDGMEWAIEHFPLISLQISGEPLMRISLPLAATIALIVIYAVPRSLTLVLEKNFAK